MIDLSKVVVVVSTHNRPHYLQRCVQGWLKSAPTLRRVYALVHHPEGDVGFSCPLECQIVHTGRVPEHAGCMSKTWNLAFQWGFRDPEVEWVICSMDDAEITPGWPEKLAAFDADLYLAPAGDLVFMLNRRALQKVGWFDERFPLIGYQEWDWQARAILGLGLDRVSLDDAHGWHHNPIGLGEHWIHIGGGAAPTTRSEHLMGAARWWLLEKWKRDATDMVGMLSSGQITPPAHPEFEWYPWFSRFCP